MKIGTFDWAYNMYKVGFDITNDNFNTIISTDEDNNMIKIFKDNSIVEYEITRDDRNSKNWKISITDSLIYLFADNIRKPKYIKTKYFIKLIKQCFEHIYDINDDWMLQSYNSDEIDIIKEIKLNILKKLVI